MKLLIIIYFYFLKKTTYDKIIKRIEGVSMKKYLLYLLILFFPLIVFADDITRDYEIKITDTDFNINEYFSLSNYTNWKVSDPSVASIVDGVIIPIKAGSTTITATKELNNYTLNLEVVNPDKKVVNTNKDINQVMEDVNVKNPKTGDFLILLFMIVGLSLVTAIFLSYNMRHNKFEDL